MTGATDPSRPGLLPLVEMFCYRNPCGTYNVQELPLITATNSEIPIRITRRFLQPPALLRPLRTRRPQRVVYVQLTRHGWELSAVTVTAGSTKNGVASTRLSLLTGPITGLQHLCGLLATMQQNDHVIAYTVVEENVPAGYTSAVSRAAD